MSVQRSSGRVLSPAHDELIAAKYLKEVKIEGKGKKQVFTYHFQTSDAPDPALVGLLTEEGFSRAAAQEITKVHADRVERAVQFARERKAAGYRIKNVPGLIVDFLKQEEKYTGVLEASAVQLVQVQKQQRKTAEQEEEEAREQFETESAQAKQLSAEEQYQKAKAALKLILKKHLSSDELKILEAQCLSGKIMAAELQEQVTVAASRLTLGELIADLKVQLRA